MTTEELEQVARSLFDAYSAGDLPAMRALLAEDLVSHITNAQAGEDRVEGREGFMSRLPDTAGAQLRTRVTQVLAIDDERVMTMVEIEAARKDLELHNFAAFLTLVRDGLIRELWMVDARPAYSDEFWAA